MEKISFNDIINADNDKILASIAQIVKSLESANQSIKVSASEISKSLDMINIATEKDQKKAEEYVAELKLLSEQQKKYDAQIKALTAQIERLTKAKKEATEAEKAAKEAAKLATQARKDEEKATKEAEKAAAKLAKEREKEQKQLEETAQKLKEESELMGREARSIEELAKQTSILAKRRREMHMAGNEKEFANLTAQIDANNKKLKAFDAEIGNFQRNVGNYSSAFEGMGGSFGAIVEGASKGKDALMSFIKTPAIAVITAIVAVISLLVNSFMKSEKGAALARKGMAYIEAGASKLIDIAMKLADFIGKMWEEPGEAAKDFGSFITDYVISRFNNLKGIIYGIGGAITAAFKGDWKKATEEAAKATINLADAVTWGAASAIADLGKEVDSTAKAFEALANAQIKFEKEQQRAALAVEDLTTAEQLAVSQLDNARISFTKRKEFIDQYIDAVTKRAKIERHIAAENVALVQQELKLNANNFEKQRELSQKLTDAKVALKQKDRELILSQRDANEKILTLLSDEFEQKLDYLIDYFDNVKTTNERIINLESTTASERARLLNETKSLTNKAWEDQKVLFEAQAKAAGGMIDMEKILAETDAKRAEQMAENTKLDEIGKTRLLEALRERRTALQDLAELEKNIPALNAKAAKEAYDKELSAFQKTKDIENTINESTIEDADTVNKKKLQNQIEVYKKQIELAEKFSGVLSDIEIKALKAQIQKAQSEMDKISPSKPKSIYDILGIDMSKEDQQMANEILSGAVADTKQMLSDLAQAEVQEAEAYVNATTEKVETAQEAYDKQKELQNQGLANDADVAAQKLAVAKAEQDKALKQKEEAVKKQAALDTIEQLSSIITAVAGMWKWAGSKGPAAWVAAGLGTVAMLGAFVASKIKAKEATKAEYSEGGVIDIEGGTHRDGKDTHLATTTKNGKRVSHFAERGEKLGILNPRANRAYGGLFKNIVDSMNALSFEKNFSIEKSNVYQNDYSNYLSRQISEAEKSNRHLATIAQKAETERRGNTEIVTRNGVIISERRYL